MSIITPDPYITMYEMQKMQDPSSRIFMRQFKKKDVDDVDEIVRLSQGSRETVKSLKDWEVIEKLANFWADRWPDEWYSFRESVKEIRDTRARKDGYSKDFGKDGVRYTASLPPRLMQLITTIFPNQEWTREFVSKLTVKIPAVRIGDNEKTSFLINGNTR